MKFRKLTAVFTAEDIALAEEVICHVFFLFNLKGVVCDIPIPEPDEGFGTQTLAPPEENAIIGFLPDMDSSDLIIDKILQKLAALADIGVEVTTRTDIVDEEDWADAWKEFFHVTRITDRLVVKPDWKPHTPAPQDVVIHIDPGMAFGTGTHPTTAMCLALIEDFMVPGHTLLDVGCGSGILMIAGAKLGASHSTGIDTDPLAVEISRRNLLKNQIPKAAFHLAVGTLDQSPCTPYDMVTANIIAQVIVEIMGDITSRLTADGIAILSGIIRERKPDVLAAADRNHLVVVAEKRQEEWVALALRHRQG